MYKNSYKLEFDKNIVSCSKAQAIAVNLELLE